METYLGADVNSNLFMMESNDIYKELKKSIQQKRKHDIDMLKYQPNVMINIVKLMNK